MMCVRMSVNVNVNVDNICENVNVDIYSLASP